MHFAPDPDVAAARTGGMMAGGVRIRLPAVFGFCGGVRAALQRVADLLEHTSPDRNVYLLGELIHNETVNAAIRSRNVHILPENRIDEVLDLARPGDVIVIPAFGVPLQSEQRIRNRLADSCRILDVTCPYVRRVWQFVRSAAGEGRTIVIHGKPDHAETRATVSRSLGSANAVVLVPDLHAARRLADCIRSRSLESYPRGLVLNPDNVRYDRLAIANQTTMLCSETQEIGDLLAEAVRSIGGDLRNPRTVCRATEERQRAAREACEAGCDLCIVIGGRTSSNTAQLHRLASRYCPAYFITTPEAFDGDAIRHYLPQKDSETTTRGWLSSGLREIVVLAGASCPESDVGRVLRRLRRVLAEGRGGEKREKP